MDRAVRFAVIGAGLVGPTHARFIHQAQGAALTVVCDLREERGRPLAETYGATWIADYQAVVRRADVDVVSICLPTALHLEVGRAAAEAGKHVIVEKPIELDLERAHELIAICGRHGVKLASIFNRRFVFGARHARDAVHRGDLGRLLVADMAFKAWRPASYYSDSGWRGTWNGEGGAALINQGVHGVDLMLWIAGPIMRVQGYARHLRHRHIEADDTTIAVCEYASGALGVIEQTTSVYPDQGDRIELHGERGTIVLEDYRIARWQLEGSAQGEPTPEELALPGAGEGTAVGHFLQIQDMVHAVRQGRAPVITGEDALPSLAVIRAIYEAERSGGPVDVPPTAPGAPQPDRRHRRTAVWRDGATIRSTRAMGATTDTARVVVDCRHWSGPLRRIWASFGYDELNWTATPRGRRNLATMHTVMEVPYTVRAHNLYTSGTGRGLPHWSSGNVYHEDATGQPVYDWSVIDPVFDAWVHHGCRPIVELGFCPKALVPGSAALALTPMPSVYSAYEAGLWAWPPRDLRRWHDLVAATVRRYSDRYGCDVVRSWYWEVWNEPDIGYWQGTVEEYCRLYDVTVAAVTGVLPEARVGGPATTGPGVPFLERFLDHCATGRNAATGGQGTRLDFVSFHTKGAAFHPWRTYGPLGPAGAATAERASPSTRKMLTEIRGNLTAIARHVRFRDLPVLVDECDASVPAHWGIYDNANFGYRNTAYYPVFQIQLMKKLLDLDGLGLARVHAATTWSWYFEGDRYFKGTRSLFTAADIATPLLNAYRMLARLPDQRLHVEVDRGGARAEPDGADERPEIDALAATDGRGRVAILVWHHCDDQYRQGAASVTVALRHLPQEGRPLRLRHYRIDHTRSNSYSAWVAAGRSQDPGPGQRAAIRARAGLEMCAPERVVDPALEDITVSFELPLPGVSLLECEAR